MSKVIKNEVNVDHLQIGGQAYYDESRYFMFAPDDPVAGRMPSYRRMGIAQQMTDGTFDFVPKPKKRSEAVLIKKLAHGRVSKTKDGAIMLYLKVFTDEDINISKAIKDEAVEACNAIKSYQLRR